MLLADRAVCDVYGDQFFSEEPDRVAVDHARTSPDFIDHAVDKGDHLMLVEHYLPSPWLPL